MKQSNIIAVYDTDFTTPLMFLMLLTDEQTNFVIGSDFYMELILNHLGIEEPYILDYGVEGEPPVSNYLTQNGVKEFYKESREFCDIQVFNLTLETLMDLENY